MSAVALAMLAAPAVTAEATRRFELVNRHGMRVTLTERGAAIVASVLPDGKTVTVAPGDAADFNASTRRYGAIVGRYAGRLPGKVTIAGRTYPLAINAQGVTLHGGDPGFDRAHWQARRIARRTVEFRHDSPDGAQGFPGRLRVRARYTLARDTDMLTLSLRADSDRASAVNLTNHVYFNLSDAATVGCHRLAMPADRQVSVNARKLPTGIVPTAETVADFRAPRPLEPVLAAGGIDTLLLLDRPDVRLWDAASGRRLTLVTDRPAVQVFTGNGFDGSERDGTGRPIVRYGGVALEPQGLPALGGPLRRESGLITPGRPYRATMRWRFDRIAPERCG